MLFSLNCSVAVCLYLCVRAYGLSQRFSVPEEQDSEHGAGQGERGHARAAGQGATRQRSRGARWALYCCPAVPALPTACVASLVLFCCAVSKALVMGAMGAVSALSAQLSDTVSATPVGKALGPALQSGPGPRTHAVTEVAKKAAGAVRE